MHQVVVMVAEVVQGVHGVWAGRWRCRVPIVGMVLGVVVKEGMIVVSDEHRGGSG